MPDRWQPDDRNQLSSDANKALDQNLVPGEAVRVIIRGAQRSAMVGTDRLTAYGTGFRDEPRSRATPRARAWSADCAEVLDRAGGSVTITNREFR